MNDRAISTTRKDAIDWGEVHGRVEAAQAALEAGLQQGTEERRQILRERAKVMAREAEKRCGRRSTWTPGSPWSTSPWGA